jgi:hypothetical protein
MKIIDSIENSRPILGLSRGFDAVSSRGKEVGWPEKKMRGLLVGRKGVPVRRLGATSRKWLGTLPMGAGLNSIELTLTGAEGSSLPTLVAVLGSKPPDFRQTVWYLTLHKSTFRHLLNLEHIKE